MKPQQLLAQRIRLLRQQRAEVNQIRLGEQAGDYGAPLDSSVVSRIEGGRRDVRVHEFLALAAALSVAPAELLRPDADGVLELGKVQLDATAVDAWIRGPLAAAPLARIIHEPDSRKELDEVARRVAGALPAYGALAEAIANLGDALDDGEPRLAGHHALNALGLLHGVLGSLLTGEHAPWKLDQEDTDGD